MRARHYATVYIASFAFSFHAASLVTGLGLSNGDEKDVRPGELSYPPSITLPYPLGSDF